MTPNTGEEEKKSLKDLNKVFVDIRGKCAKVILELKRF
jgi:hypothetical protein